MNRNYDQHISRTSLLFLVLITCFSTGLRAQNTSYNLNSVPVSGIGVVAIGNSALTSNTADYNTAVGYEAMLSNTGGQDNVAVGAYALRYNTTGLYNTAVGSGSLANSVTNWMCTAVGYAALPVNTNNFNTAIGANSMRFNTSGTQNTAVGTSAMYSNTTSSNHTALGYEALYSNTVGAGNTAVGHKALRANSTGSNNVALGINALNSNTTGSQNTAVGGRALFTNTESGSLTAIGYDALYSNTDGSSNTAVGNSALRANTTGNYNVAFGNSALLANTTGFANSAFGYQALIGCTTGINNTAVGSYATSGNATFGNVTALGNGAISSATSKMRFGNTFVTKIEGQVAYTIPSDGRFKTDVRTEDVVGLDFIQRLRPVVYNFDTRAFTEFLTQDMPDSLRQHYLTGDFGPSTAIRQSGFIAQEVEAAAKAVGYDFNGVSTPAHDGDNYSIAYSQFVVPLVKAVQEQQTLIEKQQAQIAELSALVHKLAGSAPSDKAPVIAAETATSIQVFPNPSTGRFTLRIPAEWTGVLLVTDLRGRSVLRQTLLPGNPTYQLDLTAQAKGSYLLQLDGRDGSRHTEKLVIE